MLLNRLASLFTCCTGKKSCRTLGKPGALEPVPHADEEDRELGQTTAASSRPSEENTACSPCTSPATAVPGRPLFWVGIRDGSQDSDTSLGDIMGQTLRTGGVNLSEIQNIKNLKTVTHKQTVVSEEDLRKTSLDLLQHAFTSESSSESDIHLNDEVVFSGVPSFDEKNVRQVCKEQGRPIILGRGQNGVVRLMRLRRPKGGPSLVAVKRIMLGSSSGPHPAMVKEIEAMQAVQHCSIFPKLVGVINKHTFAQEFIGNPKSKLTLSIFKALQSKKLLISVEHWVLIIRDVITGLSALHQSGWAHCDVQSNNVLLWRDKSQSDPTEARWQGRIIDLGNAKRLTGPTRHCLHLTPSEKEAYYRDSRHIPAEIVEGLEPYGVKSDTYSLGVLMRDIALQATGMFELIPLADTCTVANPDERPTLRALLRDLNLWCRDHTGYRCSPVERQWVVAYV